MVAKSYASLEKVGEPYFSNGRQYIQVRLTSGSLKQVRWYTVQEYQKMYPNETVNEELCYDQKKALGFTNGYITIFKGNTYEDREWFKTSSARYSRFWGWYFVSEEKLPEDIPEDVNAIQLTWEAVSANNKLLPENQIKKIIEDLIYDPSPSQYIGTIGERKSFKLFVEKVLTIGGAYGDSNLHTMHDEDGNIFVWATTAKNLPCGKWYTLNGTIKEHKTFRNSKQTWLTRCLSIKEVEE